MEPLTCCLKKVAADPSRLKQISDFDERLIRVTNSRLQCLIETGALEDHALNIHQDVSGNALHGPLLLQPPRGPDVPVHPGQVELFLTVLRYFLDSVINADADDLEGPIREFLLER